MALLYNVTVTHHFCHTAPTAHRGLLRWAGLWPPWTPSPVIPGPRATPSPQTWTPSPVILGPGATRSPQTWTPSPVILGPRATPSPQTWTPSPVILGPGATLSPQTWTPSPVIRGPGPPRHPRPGSCHVPFLPSAHLLLIQALPDTQPAYCVPICCLCPPQRPLCIQRVSTTIWRTATLSTQCALSSSHASPC